MGNLPWSSARGRSHPQSGRAALPPLGVSALDPDDLALANEPSLAEGLRAVQAVASAPATPAELHGLDGALAEFRTAVPLSVVAARQEGRRAMTPHTLGARLGLAAAGVLLLGFGGAGAFALSGSLPGGEGDPTVPVVAATTTATTTAAPVPVEDGDDESEIDQPEDDSSSRPTARPTTARTSAVGPDATGPAAFGLCNAWSHAKESKKTAEHSVAFRNLVRAAGGVGQVDAYCATVEHPSARDKAKDLDKDDKGKAKDADQPKDKGAAQDKDDKDDKGKGKPATKPGNGSKHKPQS